MHGVSVRLDARLQLGVQSSESSSFSGTLVVAIEIIAQIAAVVRYVSA